MSKMSFAKVSMGMVLAAAVLGLGAIGCGGGDTLTAGSFCSQVGAATCDRALACQLITSAEKGTCTTQFQASCCGNDNSCGDKPADAAEEMAARQLISQCTAAFKTFSCTDLGAGNAPAECGGTLAATSGLTSAPAAPDFAQAGAKAREALSGTSSAAH
jgi:hypothetical protein